MVAGLVAVDRCEVERPQLDLNVVSHDSRPIEHLRLRDLLGFADG